MTWDQMWQWMVSQGLITGDANYYISGQAQEAEYGHAIETAYRASNDTQRRQLVDWMWSTGLYSGDATYWYQDRGDEAVYLNSPSSGLASVAGSTPTPAPEGPAPSDPTPGPSTPGESGEVVEPEPGTPVGPGGSGDTGNDQAGLSETDLAAIYYWMPAGALSLFIDTYIQKGADAAWAAVRQSDQYEVWFPGNMDSNGNIRYAEDQYNGIRESYRDVMRAVGLEPTAIAELEQRFVDLMEGEVSPNEFMGRVEQVYTRIVSASDQIKEYYASQYGIEGLETGDLLFAALDPSFGRLTLEENFRIAEVGGAAAESGFDIDAGMAELLSERGLNLPAARQTFGTAQHLVPLMDVLAQRHFDPDDDFDINEFLQAEVFKDPTQNLRMRRLMAQERSNFAQSSGFSTSNGRITGLTAN
jgi:hypothetical protein